MGSFFQPSKSTPPLTATSASNAPRPAISADSSPENSKHRPPERILNELGACLIRFHPFSSEPKMPFAACYLDSTNAEEKNLYAGILRCRQNEPGRALHPQHVRGQVSNHCRRKNRQESSHRRRR